MKIIIKESHIPLLRRIGMIEDMIGPAMDMTYDFLNAQAIPLSNKDYDTFKRLVAIKVAVAIVSEEHMEENNKDTLMNQIKRLIGGEYGATMKDYFFNRVGNK